MDFNQTFQKFFPHSRCEWKAGLREEKYMYLKIQWGKKVLDSGCEAMNGYQGEEEETEDRNGKVLETIVVGEPSLGVKKGISDERGKENTMRTVWKMWEEEGKYNFEPARR